MLSCQVEEIGPSMQNKKTKKIEDVS